MKIRILAFLLVMVAILASPAIAAVELTSDAETSFSFNYQELDDENEDTITTTFDVELENTGTDNETVTLAAEGINSEYSVDFASSSDTGFELTPGQTRTITLDITIDVSEGLLNGGVHEDVIELEVYTVSGSFSEIKFDAEVESMVELEEIIFYLNDEDENSMEESESDDGDADLEVTPGDTVTIFFDIENLFDSTFDDGELEFDITAEMDDDDFGDEIDEDVRFSIEAGDSVDDSDEDTAIEFTVPTDAEEGDDYDLTITFEIEDDTGAEYTMEWIATFDVQREDDDARIDEVTVYPENVECSESFGLTIDVTNYGSDRQRDMYLEVESDELGLSENVEFELGYGHDNDENDEVISFQLFVDENQKEGDYDLIIRMFFDSDKDDLADSEKAEVTVTCDKEIVVEEEKEEETNTETIVFDTSGSSDSDSESSTEGSYEKVSTVEKSYTTNDVEFGLTIALIILVVLAIIALIMVGLRKK